MRSVKCRDGGGKSCIRLVQSKLNRKSGRLGSEMLAVSENMSFLVSLSSWHEVILCECLANIRQVYRRLKNQAINGPLHTYQIIAKDRNGHFRQHDSEVRLNSYSPSPTRKGMELQCWDIWSTLFDCCNVKLWHTGHNCFKMWMHIGYIFCTWCLWLKDSLLNK